MDAPANGLITIVNGLWALVDRATTPVFLIVVVIAASLSWLALVELDELNRQGTKPDIGRGL